jgi:hypothetical protein
MTNISSATQPNTLQGNKLTIHNFLRHSYSQVAQHMQDGISFFKVELFDMYKQAETCVNWMMLPVNNFLKDPCQIENEFLLEADNGPGFITPCNIIPLEIALQSPMEENY